MLRGPRNRNVEFYHQHWSDSRALVPRTPLSLGPTAIKTSKLVSPTKAVIVVVTAAVDVVAISAPRSTISIVSLLDRCLHKTISSRNQELGLLPDPNSQQVQHVAIRAMKKTVVLYPGLAVSHFVPMVQLADVLLEEGYAVVVVFIDPAMKGDIALAAVIDRVAASKPSVVFHMLPRMEDAPTFVHDSEFVARYLQLVGRYGQHLHDFLLSMPPGSLHAVLVDMMSIEVLDVTSKLGIPTYAFFPSNASSLAVSVQASSVRSEGQPSFGELGDAPLNFHGVPTMPASHLPDEMLKDPGSESYKAMINMVLRNQEANGILVNTSASIEPRAVSALTGPRRFPKMPPVYCVGPLVAGNGGQATEKHECLAWLDEQPEHSVVFLCFGSTGAGNHSEQQLKELATGLERSGHRFLWVVRAPPHDDPEKPYDPRAEPDLDAILPAGFLERTGGRGRVVKVWAPQVDVLHHAATGAFVTHCGWNSVLEGIVAGVPMLCWPLYAEQRMNKILMAQEYGVGVEMVGWQQGLVKAEEVEAKVRLVMESEEGKLLRAQVLKHKEGAARAWKDGGSSRAAFAEFLSHAGSVGPRLNLTRH